MQDPTNRQKNRHLGTIAQRSRAISSQLRHASTVGKKIVKQQYLPHMSLQYGELRPTIAAEIFALVWGTPANFNGFRVLGLGSVTARHSSSGRQPNFAALNRGRHLYSPGRPSRWAFAHILVFYELLVISRKRYVSEEFRRTHKYYAHFGAQ